MPCMINSCSSVVEQWNPVEFGIANRGLAMVLNRAHSRVFFLSILNSLWCYSLFLQNWQIDLWFPDTRVWVNVVTCLVVTVAFICPLDSISCSDNKVFDFHKAFWRGCYIVLPFSNVLRCVMLCLLSCDNMVSLLYDACRNTIHLAHSFGRKEEVHASMIQETSKTHTWPLCESEITEICYTRIMSVLSGKLGRYRTPMSASALLWSWFLCSHGRW